MAEEKKRVLFMIGINEIAEHKDDFLEAVKKRADTLRESSEKINVDICLYPAAREEWLEFEPVMSQELFGFIDELALEDGFDLITIEPKNAEKAAEKYDAYYGSPSFMPLQFWISKKPVMIADLSV